MGLPSRGVESQTTMNGNCCESTDARHKRQASTTTIITYGLITLLVTWNCILSRQVKEMRNELQSLRSILEPGQSEYQMAEVQQIESERLHEQQVNKLREEELIGRMGKHQETWPATDGSAPKDNYETLLHRIKRSAKVKSTGSGLRKKKNRKKRKGKCKKKKSGIPAPSLLPSDNRAIALHVKINGHRPYRGAPLVPGLVSDGVVRQWGTDEDHVWNQGFDISNLNARNGSAGVIVKTTGVYYIYSQVAFTLRAGFEFHEKIKIGMSGSYNELASCVSTPVRAPIESDEDYVTCHSGGVARLVEGWTFRVTIHRTHLHIYNNPAYTYFGAFLIGSTDEE